MYSHRVSILSSEIKHDNPVTKSYYLRSNSTVEIVPGVEHPHREILKNALLALHNPTIPSLYPYQVDVILNTVYRPSKLVITTPITQHQPVAGTETAEFNYTANMHADVGKVVIIDLPTGSGKTLVSLLSALYFTKARSRAVIETAALLLREQIHDTSFLNSLGDQETPALSNVILVFVPKHLTMQWLQTAQIVNQLVKSNALVLVNPLTAALKQAQESNRTVICIFDDIAKIAFTNIKLVPVIIVDEFVMRGEFNMAIKITNIFRMPIFGRLILVSADAGNVQKILTGLRINCLMKKFLNASNINQSSLRQLQLLCSASSLASAARTDILACMGLFVPIEIHEIGYVPSVVGLVFGSAFEISRRDGLQQFKSLGVDLTNCSTVQHIQRAVIRRLTIPALNMMPQNGLPVPINQPLLIQADRKQRQELHQCLHALQTFYHAMDACPICLDEIGEAAIIQPCFHATCSTCMQQIINNRRLCPLCRSPISGLVTSALSDAPEDAMNTESELSAMSPLRLHATLKESLAASVTSTLSCLDAVIMVLKCLNHSANLELQQVNDMQYEPYRVLIAAPEGIDFDQLKEHCRELDNFNHFCVHGNARRRITTQAIETQLNDFKHSKQKFNVLFTSEGVKDHVTGLDFSNIDCLVTVGKGNDIQRIGRLSRAGRAFVRGRVQYITIIAK